MKKEIVNINYKLDSIDERIEHVEKILNKEKNNNSSKLEKYANYILKVAHKDKYDSYELINQREFDFKLQQEGKLYIGSEEFLSNVKADKNYYINMSIKILEEDLLAEDELGEILRDYQRVREHLLKEMRKIKNREFSNYRLYQIKEHLRLINDDMIQAKIYYRGIVNKNTQSKWFGDIVDHDSLIDYKNPNHIKYILRYLRLDCNIDPSNSLSLIAEDIRVAIRRLMEAGSINDMDNKIIRGINIENYTLRELEEIIGMKFNSIHKRFNRICNKISLFFSN